MNDILTPEAIMAAVESLRNYRPCGIRIVETPHITKEVQCRTHRKKRINKKWRKRYGMKYVEEPTKAILYKDPEGDNVLFVHPQMADKLRIEIMDVANKHLFGKPVLFVNNSVQFK